MSHNLHTHEGNGKAFKRGVARKRAAVYISHAVGNGNGGEKSAILERLARDGKSTALNGKLSRSSGIDPYEMLAHVQCAVLPIGGVIVVSGIYKSFLGNADNAVSEDYSGKSITIVEGVLENIAAVNGYPRQGSGDIIGRAVDGRACAVIVFLSRRNTARIAHTAEDIPEGIAVA